MEDYVSPYMGLKKSNTSLYKADPAHPKLSEVNSVSSSPARSLEELSVADSNEGKDSLQVNDSSDLNPENKSRSPTFFDSMVPAFLHRKTVVTTNGSTSNSGSDAATFSKSTFANGYHSSDLFADSKYHYASDKRDEAFHAIFRSIPSTDRLIDDFGCLMHKSHTYNGRIYISENHLSFNSSFVDWMNKVTIPLVDIKHIEKTLSSSIGGTITQAITIEGADDSIYVLTGFISTDVTFDILMTVWSERNKIHQDNTNVVVPKIVHPEKVGAAEVNGLSASNLTSRRSSTSSSPLQKLIDGPLFIDNSGTLKRSFQRLLTTPDNVGNLNNNDDIINKAILSIDETELVTDNVNESSGSSSDTEGEGSADFVQDYKITKELRVHKLKPSCPIVYNGPLYFKKTEFDYSPEDNDEHVLKEITLDAPPGLVFEIIFSETEPSFHNQYLKELDSSSISEFGAFDKIENERGFTYIKALNYSVGPKSTKCVVLEKLISKDYKNAINVVVETKTPNVPSGNNFSTKTRYMFRWNDATSCSMKISYWVEWTGSSWIKGMIESSCKTGQIEAADVIEKLLRTYLKENSIDEVVTLAEETETKEKQKLNGNDGGAPKDEKTTSTTKKTEITVKKTPPTVKWFTWILIGLLVTVIVLLLLNLTATFSLQKKIDKLLIHSISSEALKSSHLLDVPAGRKNILESSNGFERELLLLLKDFARRRDDIQDLNPEMISRIYSIIRNWNV
ncbi:uncharacterized protein HLK63_L17083 [Nakaseomyces glabratus]|nr:hypothetical protein LTX96_0003995 [Nakaseomyces glabratus]UCS23332.1 uncharacterized protein GW608_L17083 [Nakaseomyces glabratus]UCS28564.1 uncharacterized protein HLK63_L17083 [Nakaseomyces glabratus]UCS33793.1 uncharacterized protein HLK64_L17083 [Nakaseomyces glabratus]UCS39022.1 uncharacterized protein HLK62_L17083 [Nakaseomyces glabratus]